MLTRRQYNRIYKSGRYSDYVVNHFKRKLKKYTVNLVNSTCLCIRFPFLYPRNRFSDRHYTNWKLRKKGQNIYNKWLDFAKENIQLYIDKFGEDCTFLDTSYVKHDYIMKLACFKDKFLYKFYDICENVLGWFHCIPTFTELDDMPDGWRKRFGIQFCKELKEAIKKCPDKTYRKQFRITQIKEKFGELRVYVNNVSPEVDRVIKKYEYLSQYVCIRCGEDADRKTLGWISPYCMKHVPEHETWKYIENIYGWKTFKNDKKEE